MAISFDKALGIHEQAVSLRSQRAEVLANNLANTDTPGFKARDIDFRAVMAAQAGTATLRTTNARHMSSIGGAASGGLMFRVPMQPSIDGNTVEEQVELSAFTKNALDFQYSTQALGDKFKGIRNALRGE